MGTRLNRYYNDPAIGQAISNLASIFEPPAPQDVLAYAQAEKVRAEKDAFDRAQGIFGDPNADAATRDRYGVIAGMYAPSQGFEARDMRDTTDRRGQDVGAASSRYGSDRAYASSTENNARDNATRLDMNTQNGIFGVASDMMAPVGQGETGFGLTDDWEYLLGVPDVPDRVGAPKPLSETEVQGQLLADAIAQGHYSAEDKAIAEASEVNIEQILDPNTKQPLNVSRADSIGQQPYATPGSAPALQARAYRTREGLTGTAIFNPTTGSLKDQATGQPLPEGVLIGEISDTAGGMATTSNVTQGNERRANVAVGRLLANEIKGILSTKTGVYGPVGTVKMLAQDIGQMALEVGGAIQETGDVPVAIEEIGQLAASVAGSEEYDPSYRMLRAKVLELAYRSAKMKNPSGEVSRFALQREMEALSQGFSANDESLMSSVQAFEDQLNRADIEAGMLINPTGSAGPGAAAPTAPTAPGEGVTSTGNKWRVIP